MFFCVGILSLVLFDFKFWVDEILEIEWMKFVEVFLLVFLDVFLVFIFFENNVRFLGVDFLLGLYFFDFCGDFFFCFFFVVDDFWVFLLFIDGWSDIRL